MYKADVLAFCKANKITLVELGKKINCSQPSISKWGEVIPELRARQLAEMFPNDLKFNINLYTKAA